MSPRPSPHHHPGPGPSGTTVPRPGSVGDFPPVFAGRGHGRPRLRRLLRPRRRLLALGLALSTVGATAAAVAPAPGNARAPAAHKARPSPGGQSVSAPVRLADADAVTLLQPGDRVDVIAAGASAPRAVVRCAPVVQVPGGAEAADVPREGALVVLRVTRRTATALAGSASASRLAFALC